MNCSVMKLIPLTIYVLGFAAKVDARTITKTFSKASQSLTEFSTFRKAQILEMLSDFWLRYHFNYESIRLSINMSFSKLFGDTQIMRFAMVN